MDSAPARRRSAVARCCARAVPGAARNSPPKADGGGTVSGSYDGPTLTVLKKRSDFLAANRGRRFATPGLVLLRRDRADGDEAIRFGITVTKKIGGAVIRNRMKRRFRELARDILPRLGVPGSDYVLIGRAGGVERDFALLASELERAAAKVGKRPRLE